MDFLPSTLPDEPQALEAIIEEHERAGGPLKKDNEAKILWADELRKKRTPYSIVYLHGFTASRGEGKPLHTTIAEKFGCNLYFARLHSHGLDCERPFEHFTEQQLLRSAVDACRIGQKIGGNVLVMGTSTGGSLALYAAGSPACPVSVKGILLYSPLIHFYGVRSLFLENVVGRSLARAIRGGSYEYGLSDSAVGTSKYWYPGFPLSAALTLGQMVQHQMTNSLYKKIHCSVFTGYYAKNSKLHDRVISTPAVKRIFGKLGTPSSMRRLINFPEAGSHVIGCSMLSQSVPSVIRETESFLRQILKMSPV